PSAKSEKTALHMYSGQQRDLQLMVSAPFSGEAELIANLYQQSGSTLMPLDTDRIRAQGSLTADTSTLFTLPLSFKEVPAVMTVICALSLQDKNGKIHPLPPPFRIRVYPTEATVAQDLLAALGQSGKTGTPKIAWFGNPKSPFRQALTQWQLTVVDSGRSTPDFTDAGTLYVGEVYPEDRDFILEELRAARQKIPLVLMVETSPDTGNSHLHIRVGTRQAILPLHEDSPWSQPDFIHLFISQLHSLTPPTDRTP
ncbi:MAG: hypothetical protein PF795_03920, partial [Kiritimatiellae bacterium]|nr:hypothetical protein [Kiritimatiellia bacterium]